MIKKFLSVSWIELACLLILNVLVLRLAVPYLINQRSDLAFWASVLLWIAVPIVDLWSLVHMYRRWLLLRQSLIDKGHDIP